MKWTDIYLIAELLAENYQEINPQTINFVKLRDLILNLPNFNDEPNRCNEKILEAIQQAWLDEL